MNDPVAVIHTFRTFRTAEKHAARYATLTGPDVGTGWRAMKIGEDWAVVRDWEKSDLRQYVPWFD